MLERKTKRNYDNIQQGALIGHKASRKAPLKKDQGTSWRMHRSSTVRCWGMTPSRHSVWRQSIGQPRGATEIKAGGVGIGVGSVEFWHRGLWKSWCPHQAVPLCRKITVFTFFCIHPSVYACLLSLWLKKLKILFSRVIFLKCNPIVSFLFPIAFRTTSNSSESTPCALPYGQVLATAAPLTTPHNHAGLQPTGTAQCPWLNTITVSLCPQDPPGSYMQGNQN